MFNEATGSRRQRASGRPRTVGLVKNSRSDWIQHNVYEASTSLSALNFERSSRKDHAHTHDFVAFAGHLELAQRPLPARFIHWGANLNKERGMSSIHSAAESTARALSHAGFEMKKLSIVGKGHHSEENARGLQTVGVRVKSWGALAASGGHLEPAGRAGRFPHPACRPSSRVRTLGPCPSHGAGRCGDRRRALGAGCDAVWRGDAEGLHHQVRSRSEGRPPLGHRARAGNPGGSAGHPEGAGMSPARLSEGARCVLRSAEGSQ